MIQIGNNTKFISPLSVLRSLISFEIFLEEMLIFFEDPAHNHMKV